MASWLPCKTGEKQKFGERGGALFEVLLGGAEEEAASRRISAQIRPILDHR